jgi:hypothetical protein
MMTWPDQTKCPKCGRSYKDELDRMQDSNRQRSKHITQGVAETFQDAWGTQYEWTITVRCECGNRFSFEEST